MAARTFQASSTPITSRHSIATSTGAEVRSPSPTVVAGLATITPASFRPMKAMKRPMPPATAANSERGMALTISCRAPTSVSTRNAAPEMNTQPSAVCQGTPRPLTTV